MSNGDERLVAQFRISYHHLTPIVWVEVLDSGVNLVVRYLCDAPAMRSSADSIWRTILDAFAAEETIDLAYPTQRFHDNATEGKKPLRSAE